MSAAESTSNEPPARAGQWKECFLPYSGGWVLLWVAMFFMLGFSRMLLADGAVARHISTGLYIIEHKAIPSSNYVWAIDPNAPWLTHEFLGDLALGGAYIFGGLNGVALLAALVIAVAIMWSYQLGRVRGMGPISGGLLVLPVILATSIHWLARSHIFSYLFFLIIYYLNFVSAASLKAKVWLTALTMMIWSNFHGSIFIGLALAALQPATALLDALLHGRLRKDSRDLLKQFSIPLAGAIGAAINLRGGSFYTYIFNYVTHPEISGKGGEWRHLDVGYGISVWCFLFLFVAMIILALLARRRPPLADVLLVLGLFAASAWSMRLIPYFALIVLPAIGPSVGEIRRRWALLWDEPRRKADGRSQAIQCSLKVVLLVVMCAVYLSSKEMYVADFPDYKLPVQAMDYISAHNIKGLAFSFDNWGPYINWRTHDRIFIDEKTDFYPVSFLDEYRTIYGAGPGWKELVDKYNFAYAVLPPSSPLVDKLDKLPDWKRCVSNNTSVLFVHLQR